MLIVYIFRILQKYSTEMLAQVVQLRQGAPVLYPIVLAMVGGDKLRVVRRVDRGSEG